MEALNLIIPFFMAVCALGVTAGLKVWIGAIIYLAMGRNPTP